MKNIRAIHVIALVMFSIPISRIAEAQTNNLVIQNLTPCNILVWADLYQQNGNSCTPNCNALINTTSVQTVAANNSYTFIGSGYPTGAWETIYMQASAGANDHISFCSGGASGNETCTNYPLSPTTRNIYLTFDSCTSTATYVHIDE